MKIPARGGVCCPRRALPRSADGRHRAAGALTLSVENDGIAPTQVREGHGLTGMRERLAAVGGTLTVEATPPRGLRLIARIPEGADAATRAPAPAGSEAYT